MGVETLTLTLLDNLSGRRCGICDCKAALVLRGHAYCLACTDVALERYDISTSRKKPAHA